MTRYHRPSPGTLPSPMIRQTSWFSISSHVLITALVVGCSGSNREEAKLYRAPPIPNRIDGVFFEPGNWEPHLAAGETGVSWGNHRVVVSVEGNPETVLVNIPWRRRDQNPEEKGVIVVDADTNKPVENALAVRVENASGEVIFQPNAGSSTYHVYYMPWQSTGGYYPTITYPTPALLRAVSPLEDVDRDSPSRADESGRAEISWEGLVSSNDPAWEEEVRTRWGARSGEGEGPFPKARATHIQSVNDFHSFFPMEVVATPEEEALFLAQWDGGWGLVPEHRDFPVRMKHFLPQHWARASGTPAELGAGAPGPVPPPPLQGDSLSFRSQVHAGEMFFFQLGLIAGEKPLENIQVQFQGFHESLLEPPTCLNCEGIDEKGQPFSKRIGVPAGEVLPLWIGLPIADEIPSGPVTGTVLVSTEGRGTKTVFVDLDLAQGVVRNRGADEPDLMSRLAWLNSTVGADPDYLIEPFEPVGVEGPSGSHPISLSVLGRRVELGELGLPTQIFSYFTPELTHLASEPEPILTRPLALQVSVGGEPERFEPVVSQTEEAAPGRVRWHTESQSSHFRMSVEGTLEYDGMLGYRIRLVAESEVEIDEIALPIGLVPDAAEYVLGLGRKGGKRPTEVDWKWAVENHQEGVWLGGVHKGLQYVLRDENYIRPLNTNFYRNQPLNMPPSWYNEGRGGIRIFEERVRADGPPAAVTAYNYSGRRSVQAGDTLHFNIRFLITPFKPIDTATHFNTRFVHRYVPVDSVKAWGGTVVNIHHANEINPYINYPFFNLDLLADYIEEAHAKGIKVKLYNTIRELTYKAHELFAFRSLGDEILNDGEGGGHSWMQEHLEDQYHSAWHAWRVDDAAMLNKGTSRWTNYYIEGLRWLAENQEIDGLYLDDIAFSRETVKRLVTVLHEHRDEVVIDLHSANQFNVRDGFSNSAMLYMEHFPFISRLWFGEYFEYDLDEDYWLTEVSGLPFGLMGEMLQDGGHPYRGMLYGMTARMYGNVDPRPVWALMNDFGIDESRMLGYWLEDTPVTTDHPRILATTYVREGSALIALASWSGQDEVVDLQVDWGASGFLRDAVTRAGEGGLKLRFLAPSVEGLQNEFNVDPSVVPVPANEGLFILVTEDPDSGS